MVRDPIHADRLQDEYRIHGPFTCNKPVVTEKRGKGACMHAVVVL